MGIRDLMDEETGDEGTGTKDCNLGGVSRLRCSLRPLKTREKEGKGDHRAARKLVLPTSSRSAFLRGARPAPAGLGPGAAALEAVDSGTMESVTKALQCGAP